MNATISELSNWEQRIIALAGVAQASALVDQLAQRGTASGSTCRATVNSLLQINPNSIEDVFPRLNDYNLGLRSVQDMFSNDKARENGSLIRYTLGMIIVRGKLIANNEMQEIIRAELSITPALTADYESPEEDSSERAIYQQIANLYQDTISQLPYRIQVQGKIENLKNEELTRRIRSLLFAGVRCAVLWHQLGGRRWHLLFYRKRIQESAANIRRKLIASI